MRHTGKVWGEVDTADHVAIFCTRTSPQRIVLYVLKKLLPQWLEKITTFRGSSLPRTSRPPSPPPAARCPQVVWKGINYYFEMKTKWNRSSGKTNLSLCVQ